MLKKIGIYLGKKCVQAVNMTRTKTCITFVCTQKILPRLSAVCIKLVQSTANTTVLHSHNLLNSISYRVGLYTVSTEPITTTVSFLNKKLIIIMS